VLPYVRVCIPAQRDLGEHGIGLGGVRPGHAAHAGHGNGGVHRVHPDPVRTQLQSSHSTTEIDGGTIRKNMTRKIPAWEGLSADATLGESMKKRGNGKEKG
jgi:hypothetical protein